MSKSLQQIIEEVLKAGERFPNKWDLKTHYIDLVEEVGELGNAVLIETGSKSTKRKRADLKDSFADVFFELILMADEANVDLEEVIIQMLSELKVRQENKEYHPE
jgi:NTP pyrophosphatase (non-canonical NTP hydrolase)